MYKKKYRIVENSNGVKEYNHLDEWKEIFKPADKPKKKQDYMTIGDMPEWYEILKKCVENKKNKKPW